MDRVVLIKRFDKLRNGATNGGEILHADGRLMSCMSKHGLGLMSIGVIIGNVLFKKLFRTSSLLLQAKYRSRTMARAMDGRAADRGPWPWLLA